MKGRDLLGAAVAMLLVGTAANGDDPCSARCECVCMNPWYECTIYCAPGRYAVCRDGWCNAWERECCCALQGPLPPEWECDIEDCGAWIPDPCARSVEGIDREKIDRCAAVFQARGDLDRWVLLRTIESETSTETSVVFSSGPSLASEVQDCARSNLLPSLSRGIGTTIQFRFIPAFDKYPVNGRRVVPEVPPGAVDAESGQLALLVTHTDGMQLGAELLFSTNERLAQLVVAGIQEWVRVVEEGDGRGQIYSAYYMRFTDGVLQVLSQSHYCSMPPESGMELVAHLNGAFDTRR